MRHLVLAAIALAMFGGPAMAGSFDGVYTGTRTTKQLSPGVWGCTPADGANATITVTNNRFAVKVGADSSDIEVAADGLIKASVRLRTAGAGASGSTVISFSGKIANGDFQMDRGNEFCATHLSLKKS